MLMKKNILEKNISSEVSLYSESMGRLHKIDCKQTMQAEYKLDSWIRSSDVL